MEYNQKFHSYLCNLASNLCVQILKLKFFNSSNTFCISKTGFIKICRIIVKYVTNFKSNPKLNYSPLNLWNLLSLEEWFRIIFQRSYFQLSGTGLLQKLLHILFAYSYSIKDCLAQMAFTSKKLCASSVDIFLYDQCLCLFSSCMILLNQTLTNIHGS